jgi:hypothetical protein
MGVGSEAFGWVRGLVAAGAGVEVEVVGNAVGEAGVVVEPEALVAADY